MALKNLFEHKGRKPGQVITQLNKIIRQNVQLVVMRERTYIKQMVTPENSLYWMELRDGTITSVGIVDHDQIIYLKSEEYWVLSHLILGNSNPIHIQEILTHIKLDYKNKNLLTFQTPRIAMALGLVEKHNFLEFSPVEFFVKMPDLAKISSDFFNFKHFQELYKAAQNYGFSIYFLPKTV